MKLGGKNRSELIRLARHLGASVRHISGTGELEVYHPLAGRIRISANRKDGARALVRIIRRAQRRPSYRQSWQSRDSERSGERDSERNRASK